MSALLELAERCEQATGPDRVLDNAIANATRLPLRNGEPYYTASLDAAMTLVPEGREWAAGTGRAMSAAEQHRQPWAWVVETGYALVENEVTAATPALALCAAALRARNAA